MWDENCWDLEGNQESSQSVCDITDWVPKDVIHPLKQPNMEQGYSSGESISLLY